LGLHPCYLERRAKDSSCQGKEFSDDNVVPRVVRWEAVKLGLSKLEDRR
jgi:hypothetical protein